jgi:Fe(II)/alpha-ketoglutarate-dependent arginine beta-hydroxylase
MEQLRLDSAELHHTYRIVDSIGARYGRVDDPEFLIDAPVLAHELPSRVRSFLNRFRRDESGRCMISGHVIDNASLGLTPRHWNSIPTPSPSLRYEVLLVLYTSLLGDVFGWATQQDGRLVHDVLPIRGHEKEQLGSGSETLLTWHTEDAFHPFRGDYVVLACLRNPGQVVTTVGNVDDLKLDPADLDVLFEERFIIRPDESHLTKNNTATTDIDFSNIETLNTAPPPVAVLFGAPDRPYIRADPYFMEVRDGDGQAARALRHFETAMDSCLADVVLAPGDYCFLDNYKVVHGRKPFTARFDGSDRWLKRVCVTRDLRKSRTARAGLTSQVVA